MMNKIIKAFNIDKDIKDFKKNYSSGDINTEVISNILQPHYSETSVTVNKFLGFLHSSHGNKLLVDNLRMMVGIYGAEALTDLFGKPDFNFDGNRKYKNYILKMNDLVVVCPDKREIVFEEGADPYGITIMNKVVAFEKQYYQLVLDYVGNHLDKMSEQEKEILNEMKSVGLLTDSNKINFKYGLEELAVKKSLKMR